MLIKVYSAATDEERRHSSAQVSATEEVQHEFEQV